MINNKNHNLNLDISYAEYNLTLTKYALKGITCQNYGMYTTEQFGLNK